MILHIDIETYSSIPIGRGVHKYSSSDDFYIQLLGYAFNDGLVHVVDIEHGESPPKEFIEAISDPNVIKKAFNAMFEITCLNNAGLITDYRQWQCVSVMALSMGLSASLGKNLIELNAPFEKLDNKFVHKFSKPRGGKRIFPKDHPGDWEQYKLYNIMDVEAERWLDQELAKNNCAVNWGHWHLDQKINSTGVKIDKDFCEKIVQVEKDSKKSLIQEAKDLTLLENPNSRNQLLGWLVEQGLFIENLTADTVKELLDSTDLSEVVRRVLEIRKLTSQTSTSKFQKMVDMAIGEMLYGCMQYNKARTGRWSSTGPQFHNMPRLGLPDKHVPLAKHIVLMGGDPRKLYGNEVFKKLIRPAIVGNLVVADFAAIEARVLAWIAGEKWAMDVFATHGKIYEAQAAAMYNVDLDKVDSKLRSKGKTATLALGYQGSIGALKAMGFDGSDEDALDIVKKFRSANRNIVSFWYWLDKKIKSVIRSRNSAFGYRLEIYMDGMWLTIKLPSGRKLRYYNPLLDLNDRGEAICYRGIIGDKFDVIHTYGGQFCENIVQAIARDCLMQALVRLKNKGTIRFHVHDEIIMENIELSEMIRAMEHPMMWAPGLVLRAAGYTSSFYKKD